MLPGESRELRILKPEERDRNENRNRHVKGKPA
jgi:hypothetical protein